MDRIVENDKLGALAGFKVIDLSRVLSGPLCTQILGDHGAEVVKIEPPSGDETRAWGLSAPKGALITAGSTATSATQRSICRTRRDGIFFCG
jgi:crotonobetainyl-CoA:carnitine CoA-transferase CaiB-like acyl-CoA transferase